MPSVTSFTPPPTLRRFMLSDVGRSNALRVAKGPVGSAKSSTSAMEILRRAAQQAPDDKKKRRTKALVVRNTYDQLRSTTIPTFKEWFPPGEAGWWKETEKTYFLRVGDIECDVLFRALDDPDDVRNILSLEVTFAWLNECREIHPDIVYGLLKRVGRYPSKRTGVGATWWGVWGDTNPPTIGSWWYYMMEGLNPDSEEHEPMDNGWAVFHQPSGRSPAAENIENLPAGYYDTKGLPEDYIRVYIDGEYGLSKGGQPVWKMFRRDWHVAKEVLCPTPGLTTVIGFDPGMNSAALFMQQSHFGQIRTLDEVITQGMGAERLAKDRLKPLIAQKYVGGPVIVCADPAADSRSQTNERTVCDVLRNAGLRVKTAATNALAARLGAVDSYLSRNTEAGPATLISPHCRTIIAAAEGGYRYKKSKAGAIGDEPEKNAYSHPADAWQYGTLYFSRADQQDAFSERRKQQALAGRKYRPADQRMGY